MTPGQTADLQAPEVSTTTSGNTETSGSSRSLPSQNPSAGQHASPPLGSVENNLEELQELQKDVPSNPSATRRLPKRTDFPASIDLEIVHPVKDNQIEFAIVMLQDHKAKERSLEQLARKLQDQYPENAYILIRCPKQTGNGVHGWASTQDDLDFVATSWMLLFAIISRGLIGKCGFKAKQIIILGHGQGGTAALTAVSLWDSIQFTGVIAIGGTMPARLDAKSQTPALLLGNFSQSSTTHEVFTHITRSNRMTLQDMHNLKVDAPDLSGALLEPIREFFDHRLRREEWKKQAIISFGEQLT